MRAAEETLSPVFPELTLSPAVRAALGRMGIVEPTPIQAQGIPALMAGHDVIGQARTGSGKTLAFSLPAVEGADPRLPAVQTLVLVPTRELAIQVASVLEPLAAARRLKVEVLVGGRSMLPQRQALLGGAQLLVGAPGRTLDHIRQGNLDLRRLRFLVLDEGDEMLDRGFVRDVESIIARTPRERQTALFSATLPEWVASVAQKHLRNPVTVHAESAETTPLEIEHLLYDVQVGDKPAALRRLLDERGEAPVIVFGRTKHGVKKLATQLVSDGYPAAALQGNLSQNARERVMADFRSGRVPILLATNVAARGIDVQGVERVINYELPESPELFTHRVGRTGRMGQRGEAITFLTPDDAAKWKQFEKSLGRSMPRRPWPHGSKLEAHTAPEPNRMARPAAQNPARRPAPAARADRPVADRDTTERRYTGRRFFHGSSRSSGR